MSGEEGEVLWETFVVAMLATGQRWNGALVMALSLDPPVNKVVSGVSNMKGAL